MKKVKVPIKWTCPNCGKKHNWKWDESCICKGPIMMECEDGCGYVSPFLMDENGKLTEERKA